MPQKRMRRHALLPVPAVNAHRDAGINQGLNTGRAFLFVKSDEPDGSAKRFPFLLGDLNGMMHCGVEGVVYEKHARATHRFEFRNTIALCCEIGVVERQAFHKIG